jgi:mRNA interferase MazF
MPIRRGEIYFANLSPVIGREQAGSRPVLVISDDSINDLPLVVTVVVGTRGSRVSKDYPTNVRVTPNESGLPDETVFLCFQIRSIDRARLSTPRAGVLAPEAFARVETAIRRCLRL